MTTLSVEEVLAKVLGSDDEDGEFGNLDSDSEEEESLDSPVISSLSGNLELSLERKSYIGRFIRPLLREFTIQ